MRLYPSLPGREVLEIYYNSIVQTNQGDAAALSETMQDLTFTYPDVDPKNKLSLARRAINLLLQQAETHHAIQAAHSVQGSLALGDHTSSAFIIGDTLIKAGQRNQDFQLLYDALAVYQSANYGGKLREDKINATYDILIGLIRELAHGNRD